MTKDFRDALRIGTHDDVIKPVEIAQVHRALQALHVQGLYGAFIECNCKEDQVMNDIMELAAHAGQVLQEKGLMLATAESCTGGGVSQAVTEIAGSSAWFERGFVTYSNTAKNEMLGVSATLIEQHGAVSEEVAAAMASGALVHSRAQIALSTTGIAGPGGAVPGKPVGTVCFGWAHDGKTHTERHVFPGDRQSVREQTVRHALEGLLRMLEQA